MQNGMCSKAFNMFKKKNTGNIRPERAGEVTQIDKNLAEQLKQEGNQLFSQGKYDAAAQKYTEALTMWPKFTVALINRANCHKQKGSWNLVRADCQTALSIDKESMKAHYFLGIALEKQLHYKEAIGHLKKSLELAREKDDNIKDQIWRMLASINYKLWENEASYRKCEHQNLKARLKNMFQELRLSKDELDKYKLGDEIAWDKLFDIASQCDIKKEPLGCFTCPLTMEIFREPVVAPSGLSYEKSAILQHLEVNGKFDPITRTPLEAKQLVPNKALQSAIENYLSEHPWAWKDCI